MATAQKIWWVISELAELAEGVSVGQQEEKVDGGGRGDQCQDRERTDGPHTCPKDEGSSVLQQSTLGFGRDAPKEDLDFSASPLSRV